MHERHREIEPALHASRVAAYLPVCGIRQTDAHQELVGARLAHVARERLQRRLQPQVLAPGEERVERGLLEGGADRRAHLRPLADDVEAGHARRAIRGRQQRRQHVDGR